MMVPWSWFYSLVMEQSPSRELYIHSALVIFFRLWKESFKIDKDKHMDHSWSRVDFSYLFLSCPNSFLPSFHILSCLLWSMWVQVMSPVIIIRCLKQQRFQCPPISFSWELWTNLRSIKALAIKEGPYYLSQFLYCPITSVIVHFLLQEDLKLCSIFLFYQNKGPISSVVYSTRQWQVISLGFGPGPVCTLSSVPFMRDSFIGSRLIQNEKFVPQKLQMQQNRSQDSGSYNTRQVLLWFQG